MIKLNGYKFLDNEMMNGVIENYMGRENIITLMGNNPNVTKEIFSDYVRWFQFKFDNEKEVMSIGSLNTIIKGKLLEERLKSFGAICANYYQRDINEFIKNVNIIQDVIDSSGVFN